MARTVSKLGSWSGLSPFIHQFLDLLGSETGVAAPKALTFHGLGSLAEVERETHPFEHLVIPILRRHSWILSLFRHIFVELQSRTSLEGLRMWLQDLGSI